MVGALDKFAWVRDEAAAGRDSGRLIPATIDGTDAPLGFRQFQTIDLKDWKRGARARGYKQLEQAIAETSAEPPVSRATVELPRKHGRSRWLAIASIAALLFVAGALAIWPYSRAQSLVPIVAVAPADRSQEGASLARDLLVKLGSLRSARTDAVRLTAPTVGDTVHADFVFEAAANNVALLSGNDGAILWSKDFEGQASNRTALEQSMAYTSGQVLDCALQASEPSPARLDEQTLKLFLNGCALFAERYQTDSGSVVPIFSQIIASAPHFQPAWSKLLLAEAQALRGQMMFYDRYAPGGLPEHIRQARRLNPRLPEIYIAEAALLPIEAFEQRWPLFEEAVKLNPDNPDLRIVRSEFFGGVGRNNNSLDDAKEAVNLNPLSPGYRSNLIQALAYAGQLPAAEDELRRAEQLWPGSPTIDDARFRLHSRYGDGQDALRLVHSPEFRQQYPTQDMEKYLVARINPTRANVESAIAAARSGQLAEGRKLSQLEQVLADFGRDDELYSLLMSLPPDRLRFVSEVFYRPNFKQFRHNPRFMQIEKRAGMIGFWRKTGKWPDFCFDPDLPYKCDKAT